jgi:hypothetical protein
MPYKVKFFTQYFMILIILRDTQYHGHNIFMYFIKSLSAKVKFY